MAAQSLADPTADLYDLGWLWWKLPQLCLLHQIPPQDNHNLQSRLDGCTAKPAPIQIPQLLIEPENLKFYKNVMGGNYHNYVYSTRFLPKIITIFNQDLQRKPALIQIPQLLMRARKSEGNDHNQKKIKFTGADS